MARQAINVGFPNPNFVSETGTRQAILPGVYLSESNVVSDNWGFSEIHFSVVYQSPRKSPNGAVLAGFNNFPFGFVADFQPTQYVNFAEVQQPPYFDRKRREGALSGFNNFPFELVEDVPPIPYVNFAEAQQPPYWDRKRGGAALAGFNSFPFELVEDVPPTPFVAELQKTFYRDKARRGGALAGAQLLLRQAALVQPIQFTALLPVTRSRNLRRGGALAGGPILIQSAPGIELRATMSAVSAVSAAMASTVAGRVEVDPLWVALEVDLWDAVDPENPDNTTTLRLSNRGPLTRVANGEIHQYDPRLQVPIQVGSNLTIFSGDQYGGGSMFQQPLRAGSQSTSISWAISPDFVDYLNKARFRWIGRVWRLYEGRTATEIGVDVDADLTLIYTGNVAGLAYSFDGSPTATMQGIDASSNLDKSLVDDIYPDDFTIESLRGKPRPQLWGRRISIVPVLEDQANLIYRVSRAPLDDVTEVRVGGVPWRRSGTAPGPGAVSTYQIVQTAGPGYVMLYADAADVAFWLGAGATVVPGSGLPLVPPGSALYTIVQSVGPSYIGALDPDDVAYWVSNGATVTPYTGAAPPPATFTSPGASAIAALNGGEWFADLANGTIQLGSAVGGAEVRVDAQAVGWQTLDTAALITDICLFRAIPVDPASMAQLHLDWPGLIGFHTGTEGINCLDALDRITLGNLCWWALGPDSAVVAGAVDAPELGVPEFVLFGSDPGVSLDLTLFPTLVTDPIPKELMTIGESQLIPPAWRFRVQYEEHESPESTVLDGANETDKSRWASRGLVRDWSPGDSGFDLTPDDGRAIRLTEPRAQDIFLESLAWREAEAAALRFRGVQRIMGNLPRETFTVSAWMPSGQPKFFQVVSLVWVADDARARQLTGGLFRIIGITRSAGGGAQQLTLWGSGGSVYSPRSDAASPIVIVTPPPYVPPVLPPPGPTPTPVLTVIPPNPSILDTTPLGTTVAQIFMYMSDGSPYTGGAPILTDDDGGRFIITGPSSGTGPYDLDLNPAGPGLPLSSSIEHVIIVAP